VKYNFPVIGWKQMKIKETFSLNIHKNNKGNNQLNQKRSNRMGTEENQRGDRGSKEMPCKFN